MTTPDLLARYRAVFLKGLVEPIFVARASGATVIDEAGNPYVDFTGGFAVNLVGWGHPRLETAVMVQAHRFIHCCPYLHGSSPALRLAERLLGLEPSLSRVFFCTSGSEAAEAALRLVRTRRRGVVISLHGNFHGRTYGALSISGIERDRRDAGPLMPGVVHLRPALDWSLEAPAAGTEEGEGLEALLDRLAPEEGTALFLEPIQADAGVVVIPDAFVQHVAQVCRRRGLLLVIDEVQSGLGRTGRMFAYQHVEGVRPDVLLLGKALGGGFPLGAVLCTEDAGSSFTFHDLSSTMGGNPVACQSGLAVLNVLEEEGLCDRAGRLGTRLIAGLREMRARAPVIGEVRGRGLLVGVEIVAPRGESAAPDRATAEALRDGMRTRGFLTSLVGESTMRLTPPLTIAEDEVDGFLEAFEDAARAAVKDS